ncbi:two-component system sensor histidine kinase NtrB [Ideonella sp. BN130291]|uniref:two-component system sensor histidine kinase NtrB n=1 Tax=Ideonella sp. BN130291 TaxID=3112940 RepID=UPI002E271B92|nr:ATP-binding protein [Ideonella sp. BN130291]
MKANDLPRGNRRQRDRRRGDRRREERSIDESWFGVLGVNGASDLHGDSWDDEDESRLEGWRGDDSTPTDSRFLPRQALRLISGGGSAFQRIYRTFVTARAALGVALVVAQLVGAVFGLRGAGGPLVVCLAYAAQAIALWIMPRFRAPASPRSLARVSSPQWLATIGVDLLAFSVLHLLEPTSNFNYVALLVLPVLMAGVLTPRVMALGAAAAIALMLLGSAWRAGLHGGDMTAPMTQAGLAGIGFFVITLLAGELAGRLAREELTARGTLQLARQQAQLNRLVIEQMQDGVMVVDRRGRVRTANPAARLLLGAHSMCRPAPFVLQETLAWNALTEAVQRAFTEGSWPEAGREVVLPFEPGLSRTLVVRVRFTRRLPTPADAVDNPEAQGGEELCVLFLEDLRSVQGRTRQEKLAAMGRVSAGIAHEIRNPLAAISQANALLEEDALTPDQHRLTRMVAENAERLKRIVDDVMEVAPGTPPSARVIDATAEVAKVCSEWARTVHLPLGEGSRLRVKLPREPVGVAFEPDHLRRVLINLLDNARRHASENPGAIVLRLRADNEHAATLSVASDGAPIPPEVERHLFEPFFSTRSRGTGLGLYICKELCERYGATIDYRPGAVQDAHRNVFLVVMKRGALLLPEQSPLP